MLRAVSDRRSGGMAKSLQALYDKAVAPKERGKPNDAIAICRSAAGDTEGLVKPIRVPRCLGTSFRPGDAFFVSPRVIGPR
jgi:hypothetical protein